MTDEDALRCGGGPQPVEPQPEVLARVARTSVSVFRRCCCQCSALATPFYRFLARFSGRRRRTSHWLPLHSSLPPTWFWFCLLVSSTLCSIAEACSSRATPKPRPPAPTPRPNITFHTYTCPPAYAAWYCLNGATCFTVKIENSLLYNCECADGYMGPRCEYKDLDGTYLPSQRRFMMETASIAGGATIAVVLMFIVCVAAYIRVQRRTKNTGGSVTAQTAGAVDCVDGGGGVGPPPGRVFGNPWRNQQPHNTMTVPMGPPPPSLRPASMHQESPMMQPDVHWTERQTRLIATDDRIRVGAPP